MLEFQPTKRITAQESLKSLWLKQNFDDSDDIKMNEEEFHKFLQKSRLAQKSPELLKETEDDSSNKEDVDSDRDDADLEDNQFLSDDEISDENEAFFDRRFLDRSFANQKFGYIGYGDGILLDELDVKGNWQFD